MINITWNCGEICQVARLMIIETSLKWFGLHLTKDSQQENGWIFGSLNSCLRVVLKVYTGKPHMWIYLSLWQKQNSSEGICRRNVLIIFHVIVNIGDITSIHLPQVNQCKFPAKRLVKHHGTGHLRDRANWPFSYTILIMCIDEKTTNMLVMVMNALKKIWFENTVIRTISINHNTMTQSHFS